MGWTKDASDWVLAKDPAMDADAKLSRWTNLTTAVSVIVGIVGWIIGLLLSIPWQLGFLSGLAAWFVLMNAVVARGRREVRNEETATADKVEQLTVKLQDTERERDSLREEMEQLKSRADEKLVERARELSDKLFQFGKQRDEEDPQHKPDYPAWIPQDQQDHDMAAAKGRYDDETWSQYRQEYEGEVRAVLGALKQCGRCDAEERKEIQGELDAFWRTPGQRIERLAARLAAFGKGL